MSYRTHPEYCKTFYMKVSRCWHIFQEELARRFSPLLFTVSEYSKKQMIECLKIPSNKIVVLGNGWEHFKEVTADETLKERHPDWFANPYFFSFGQFGSKQEYTMDIRGCKETSSV